MDVRFRDVLAFAVGQWRERPATVAIAAALMFGGTIAEIFTPVAIGRLVDALGSARPDTDAAVRAFAAVVGLGTLFQVLQKSGDYVWAGLEVGIMRRVGADAFARVQRYSSDWHADTFAGSTVRNITRGVWAFDMLGDALYFHLGPSVAITVGAVVLMIWHWPLMGLVFLAGAVLYTAASVRLSLGYVAPLRRVAVESDSRVGGALADGLTCNAVIKSTAAEAREDARLGGVLDAWRANMLRSWYASIHTGVAQNAILLLLQAVLVGGALWLWSIGRASAGDVAYVLTSFLLVGRWLRDVGMQLRIAQQAANDLERLIEYHRSPPTIADPIDAVPLAVSGGAIRFEHVRFHYGRHATPLFADLSVAIAPGERVALVGHSGSGKSTFVKLLQRLHDLQGGGILIDGQDIATATLASLREAVALVPQEPVLFHRSLAENIAYARPDATMAEVERAARLAHADGFIARLPEGYATLVGERGVKLSGGERQRVAIARAILADRPILILDEATSSLDSEAERLIQDALEHLMAGRTTLVIAHRLSTVREVDRILVFERGRIVEQGTHKALLARPDGRYRGLYLMQAAGMELPEQTAA
ncbi:MAG: ABC transporter ATP-binding protein [Geminicoccaceae bacterium]